ADGRFEIAGIQPASRVAVYVNKPGYAGVWSPRVLAKMSEDLQLPNLVLKKAARELTGQVVNDQGQPVANARVTIHDFGLGRGETVTDAVGHFRLRAVPERDAVVIVDSP